MCLYVCVNMRVQPRWILRGALICLWSGSCYFTVIFASHQPLQHIWLYPVTFILHLCSYELLWPQSGVSIYGDYCSDQYHCRKLYKMTSWMWLMLYGVPKFSFEVPVLKHTVSILCYLMLLFHIYMNIVFMMGWGVSAKLIPASLQSLISQAGKTWCMSSFGKNRVSPAWWISLHLKMGFQSEPSSLSFDRAYNWTCQWQFNMIHLFTNPSSESSITSLIPEICIVLSPQQTQLTVWVFVCSWAAQLCGWPCASVGLSVLVTRCAIWAGGDHSYWLTFGTVPRQAGVSLE